MTEPVTVAATPPKLSTASRDLAAASIIASLLAYVLVIVGTRAFGADRFAAVSVVWTWWMLCAAVVTFPLQHWAIRTAAAGASTSTALRASLIAAALLGTAAAATALHLSGDVFADSLITYAIVIAVTPVGSWCIGVSRAFLVSTGRVRMAALSIGLENVIRLCVGVTVVFADRPPAEFALSVPAGFLVATLALRRGTWQTSRTMQPVGSSRAGRSALGGLFFASVVNQLVQSATPLIPPLVGGADDDITVVFVLLLLARVPYFLVNTIMIGWIDRLTMMFVNNQRTQLNELLRRITAAVCLSTLAVGLLAPWIGAPMIKLAFGDDLALGALDVTIFALAGVATVVLLILLLVLVAAGRPWWACGSSAVGAGIGFSSVVLQIGSPAVTAGIMFLTAVGVGATLAAGAVVKFLPPAAGAAGRTATNKVLPSIDQ